ncbi:hypothetical protein CERSUDRAFT_118623 [Gelatoporia subvermispora B]|uniref:Protein PBN1 n=1 Tax=Ceriporiopsis subvermispora (strain B) TaxID=914234 RepID=M2PAN4_CERS8|nr:hypothetical protein CERSUDRAFT_118623 [Gelatoporia subvermispora B]
MRLVPTSACTVSLLLAQHALVVLGNTEIVNFAAGDAPDASILRASEWPVLRPGAAELLRSVEPAPFGTPLGSVCQNSTTAGSCPHELWLSLDLDSPEWRSYGKFTLRISWPASSPADFAIDIHSPREAASFLGYPEQTSHSPDHPLPSTRRKVARIRLVDTGLLTPTSSFRSDGVVDPVPFIVLLEPLYMGVLPASVLPVVLFIIAVAFVAVRVVLPLVEHRIYSAVQEAKVEFSTRKLE